MIIQPMILVTVLMINFSVQESSKRLFQCFLLIDLKNKIPTNATKLQLIGLVILENCQASRLIVNLVCFLFFGFIPCKIEKSLNGIERKRRRTRNEQLIRKKRLQKLVFSFRFQLLQMDAKRNKIHVDFFRLFLLTVF